MAEHSVYFFLSYSINKAPVETHTRHFIQILKSVITLDLKCKYVDLFEDVTPVGIHEGLVASLRDCDCLIAEASSAAPNVLYEMGFADALGMPVVPFLDSKRNQSHPGLVNATLSQMRARLFGPNLPSDVGDLRWHDYDLGVGLNPGREDEDRVRRQIRSILEAVVRSDLMDSLVRSRRKIQATFHSGLHAVKESRNAPARLWLLSGLTDYIDGIYLGLPNQKVQVDESIYRSMLKVIDDVDLQREAYAIADLTSSLEPYLLEDDPNQVRVNRRVFVFNNYDAFTQRLESQISHIWHHARTYECFVIDRDYVARLFERPRLAPESNSFNLLSTRQATLWYSESAAGQTGSVLNISHDSELQQRVAALFNDLFDHAVNVTRLVQANPQASPGERVRLVKSEWFEKRRLGEWQPTWHGGTARDHVYYTDYETHIRAWIPHYDSLARRFREVVKRAVQELSQNGDISIIEVGPGSGEITGELLRDILSIKRADTQKAVATEYVVYEEAEQMMARLAHRDFVRHWKSGNADSLLQEGPTWFRPREVQFLQGIDENLHRSSLAKIVIGSLVHHYIDVLDNKTPSFAVLLRELDAKVHNLQQIVLSGLFYGRESQKQIEWWRAWMQNTGSKCPSGDFASHLSWLVADAILA